MSADILIQGSSLAQRSQMGGKGANLAALATAGLPVPPWFVVSAEVFDRVRTAVSEPLEATLRGVDYADPTSVDEAARAIEVLFAQAPVDAALQERIRQAVDSLGASFVAVRSSAAAEDSAKDSFAGQLETFLYVAPHQVLDQIRGCWASAYGSRVLSYMNARGLSVFDQRVGVVVQTMVESCKSGVLFTANPTGSIDEIVIVAGYGLGEGVVADLVETDTLIYERRDKQWQVQLAEKQKEVVFDREGGGGTALVDVTGDRRAAPVLEEAERDLLVELSLQIEKQAGRFVDVEWAIDAEGGLFITQSRPITTIPAGEISVFDNSNVVESYPGHTLPLTVSYIRQGYEQLFRNAFLRNGASRAAIAEHDHVFKNLLGYLDGRVYYNLGNWHRMFRILPGVGPYLEVWEEMLGIAPSDREQGGFFSGLAALPRWVWVMGWSAFHFTLLDVYMGRAMNTARRLHQEFAALDVDALDAVGLARAYRRWTAVGTRGWDITLLNDGYCFIWSSITRRVLARAGVGEELFGRLFAGDEDLESVQPVRKILALAETLRAIPDLKEFLNTHPGFDRAAIAAQPAGKSFLQGLDAYLDAFGDRCIEELKLESASFRDDPHSLVQLIVQYAGSDLTVAQTVAREQAIKHQAKEELSKGLEGKWLYRPVLAVSMYFARRSIRYREASRLERARGFGRVRAMFRAMGRVLVDSGVLAHEEDIFYLGVEEVLNYAGGTGLDPELQPLVDRRRAHHQQLVDRHPPERVRLIGPVGKNLVPRRRVLALADDDDGVLRGTGCSTGRVQAEALVVLDAKRAGDCEGRILVAEMTDPGWVFLMLSAGGLVVEKGSLLSHTAIIGRELGIPTVVGVKGATQRIRSGDLLSVDGGSGEVRIVDESDGSPA